MMLEQIISEFFPGKIVDEANAYGNGHINDTYKVVFKGETEACILQKINIAVFTNPVGLVDNHIKIQKFLESCESDLVIPLLIPVTIGGYLHTDESGGVWRMMNFIPDSYSIGIVTEGWQASQAGNGYGWFARSCAGLDASEFVEAIKDFHRLSFRVWQLDEAIKGDRAGRLESVQELVDFYKERQEKLMVIEKMVDAGEIPQRVVHNDTKIDNLLFRGEKASAVIDLDTVGPGILYYDFGDSIRTISNSAAEDEKDLSKVEFSTLAYREFARGYLSQVKSITTPGEAGYYYLAPVLMTYIMGIRFLADYLNGDVYYKVGYPEHNVVRSRVQRRLIECMEEKESYMKEVIEEIL
ncbi:MAG: aminoglycoside phosphotransferase family protein [Bacteroidetes bacterium]|nr:aminoglycoside phosphotransferase family protein [Bacteroidota bacterium]